MRTPSRFWPLLPGISRFAAIAALTFAGCTPAIAPVTPGVGCGPRRCVDRAPVCCVELMPGSLSLTCSDSRFPCGGSRYECDESPDCATGLLCCMRTSVTASGVRTSTTCASRCEPEETEVCNVAGAACSNGGRCCQTTPDFATCGTTPAAVCPGDDGGVEAGAPDASGG